MTDFIRYIALVFLTFYSYILDALPTDNTARIIILCGGIIAFLMVIYFILRLCGFVITSVSSYFTRGVRK